MANTFVGRMVFGAVLATSAGCADVSTPHDEEATQGVAQGLTFERHDAQNLVGSFVDADGTILFNARALSGDRAELEFNINGKVLGYEALSATDAHDGFYRVDADTVFDAADLRAAQAALDALTAELGMDVTAMNLFEASVPKMAYFVANQTVGADVASFQRNEYSTAGARNKTVNDDGLVCIKKTTTLTAWYIKNVVDTRTPSIPVGTYSQNVVVGESWGTSACGSGDYSCMGRCGGGCGGFGGGWTLDCLEHDVCSHNLCASGGGSDKNCGQEYNHASSDIFSSCSGT